MNVLFICCAYSEEKIDFFRERSKRGFQFAAQNFQSAIIKGMISNGVDLTVLSFPSLSTFPFGFKDPFIKGDDFIYDGKIIGKSLSIVNLPFINKPIKFEYQELVNKWLQNHSKTDSAIIVYGINPSLINIVYNNSTISSKIPKILIALDLPEYMHYNKIYTKLGLREKNIQKSYQMLQQFDGYVLLTDAMKDKMGFNAKPYTVIEGVYECFNTAEANDTNIDPSTFKILYSGSLAKRYGIIELLEGFIKLKYSNCQLLLCGAGDAIPEIKRYSHTDNRIQYLGIIPMYEVRELQKKVSLLINPRSRKEEFTKYSFPSKTMEYMASGTPTMMAKLDCLPSEYHQHLLFLENESSDGISEGISQVYNMPIDERFEFGKNASEFILEEKNPKIQSQKIIKLINQIISTNVNI